MRFEAVIIGSGFGGAIAACRLAKRWPGQVVLLERGKRYPLGSFPRNPTDMARNFWSLSTEQIRRPRAASADESHGLFDIRNFRHIDVVTAAGLGGGSLVYANVFMEPPPQVFEQWPASCRPASMSDYYRVAKSVLGARPIPVNADPRRRIRRTEIFADVAKEMGRESVLTDINVFFGNDFNAPTEIGVQERNRYGAVQTSCIYCAECDVGCNTHSKNTLDLNYLFAAEARYGLDVRCEHIATSIRPLNADGSDGYEIGFKDLTSADRAERTMVAKRVIVAAGAVGSTEFLLRAKHRDKTLPKISSMLGRRFSANGDFLSAVIATDRAQTDANYGPVITQRIDMNLFDQFDRTRAFIVEDAAYPSFASWLIQASRPGILWLGPLWKMLRHIWARFTSGASTGHIGFAIADILADDLANRSVLLLCMGLDQGDGVVTLDRRNNADIRWPYRNSLRLYRGILSVGKRFKAILRARHFIPMPTWFWPLRKNVCVHALGGCALGTSAADGVTSAEPSSFGQVFGYIGLYVADGAIVPTAVGANPSATIAALAERVAEGITGIKPDSEL